MRDDSGARSMLLVPGMAAEEQQAEASCVAATAAASAGDITIISVVGHSIALRASGMAMRRAVASGMHGTA